MIRHLAPIVLVTLMAGCGDNSARFLIDPPATQNKIPVRVTTIEVQDVSLPAYASALEMSQQEDNGALRNLPDTVWADDPVRGVTTALARALDLATTANVAAEPWPLEEPAQARLDVRVERMLARADGEFELSGQFAVASPDSVIRERLERFDIRIPVANADPTSIAAASGGAISALAEQIAAVLRR